MVLLPRKYLKDYLHRLIQNFHGCNRKGTGNMGGLVCFSRCSGRGVWYKDRISFMPIGVRCRPAQTE